MIKAISHMFFKPDVATVVEAELSEARLSLLEAKSGLEFATAMVDYHGRRVLRLQATLDELKKSQNVE